MPCEPPICVSYPLASALPFPQPVMGAVSFGTSVPADAASLWVPLMLCGEPRVELWSSASAVEHAATQGLQYAHNGAALWGSMTRAVGEEAGFERTIEDMYGAVLAQIRAAGYPHLLRMWNYFPGIHTDHAGLDRYQRFCVGRQRAFDQYRLRDENEFPAATVIGTHNGGIALYFLAARTPGEPHENPRQVSAYHYPQQYGPASPAFSRSMLKRWDGVAHLYISGTASIVGHESRHRQLEEQFDEILRNLHALVAQVNIASGIHFNLERRAQLKVYVRDINDVPALRARLPNIPALFLAGDICRRDLRVEIEALLWSAPDA